MRIVQKRIIFTIMKIEITRERCHDMLVIMVCSLGISSKLLVKKLEAEAKAQKMKIEIQAMALQEVQQQTQVEFLLVSPQVSYAKRQLLELVKEDHDLYVIDGFDYSSLNAKRIIEQIADKLPERTCSYETGNLG